MALRKGNTVPVVTGRSATRDVLSSAREVPLLRYRFDSGASIDLHFQRVDGRTLFYWPVRLDDRIGDLVVEFVPAAGGPPCPLRGRVVAHANGTFKGSWIELPVQDVAYSMKRAMQSLRSRLRFAVDQTVTLVRQADGSKILCGLSDISVAGAGLSRLPGSLTPGEEVSISLLQGPLARLELPTGRVVWADARRAGVQFAGTAASPGLSKLLQQAEQCRDSASEISHPPSCRCARGQAPLDAAAARPPGRRLF